MRILVSCLQGPPGYAVPAYDFWRIYLKNGIEEAGHEFVEVEGVDWIQVMALSDPGDINAWRARTWETTLDFIRREHRVRPIHLFLSYFFPKHVDRTAIAEIGKLGIPCVNFFCDNVREFSAVPREFAGFDLHWVPEFEALEMYRAAGLPHICLPMPCWVPENLRAPSSEETDPPTFIGRGDLLRRDLLGRALRVGADFQIRGAGWSSEGGKPAARTSSLSTLLRNQIALCKSQGVSGLYHKLANRLAPLRPPDIPAANLGPPVTNSDYIRISRDAQVVLGISRVPTPRRSFRNPMIYSRLRDIEAPMLGACYLAEWSQTLEKLYELGSEIESYRSAEELAEKLKYLASAPHQRRKLRQAGQRRALSHAIPASIGKIQQALSIGP